MVTGSWGQSQVDLSSFAVTGNTIRLRFEFGVDGCNGLDGWYLDDVTLCSSTPAAGSVPDGNGVPGVPLLVNKGGGGDLVLTWGSSCNGSDTDFGVYEGTVGDFTSHLPVVCTTSGLTSDDPDPGAG